MQLKDWQMYPPTPLDQVLQLQTGAHNSSADGIDVEFAVEFAIEFDIEFNVSFSLLKINIRFSL